MTSDPFFIAGNQIVETKRAAQDSGRNLVTWQSVGVFFHPDTPAAIRKKLCVHKPTNEAEWESLINAREGEIPDTPSEEPKSISTKPVTINRN